MCFECDAWRRVVDVTVNLRKVFRQRDEGFVDMLNRMRLGQLGQRDLQRLDALQHTRFPKSDGISPTVLFPDRRCVRRLPCLATPRRRRRPPGLVAGSGAVPGVRSAASDGTVPLLALTPAVAAATE